MASFLGIPREVRDDIIALVLLAEREYEDPRHPSVPHKAPTKEDFSYLGQRKRIFYETGPIKANAASLLRVNRQVKAETQDALSLISRHRDSYLIDVTFLNERELHHQWTMIPVLTNRLDTVHVRIRSQGTGGPIEGNERQSNIWGRGCGGPPRIVWLFYVALIEFLKAGPAILRQESKAAGQEDEKDENEPIDRDMTVRNLDLDFVSGTDPSRLAEDTAESKSRWMGLRDRSLSSYRSHSYETMSEDERAELDKLVRPEWLAGYLLRHFPFLLSMNGDTPRYGSILYERVGSITFSVDGRPIETLNLAKRLSDSVGQNGYWTYTRDHDERQANLNAWKESVYLARKEAGLPVLPFTERALKDMGRETQPGE